MLSILLNCATVSTASAEIPSRISYLSVKMNKFLSQTASVAKAKFGSWQTDVKRHGSVWKEKALQLYDRTHDKLKKFEFTKKANVSYNNISAFLKDIISKAVTCVLSESRKLHIKLLCFMQGVDFPVNGNCTAIDYQVALNYLAKVKVLKKEDEKTTKKVVKNEKDETTTKSKEEFKEVL